METVKGLMASPVVVRGKNMSDVRAEFIYSRIGKPENVLIVIIIMNIILAGKLWSYYVWN